MRQSFPAGRRLVMDERVTHGNGMAFRVIVKRLARAGVQADKSGTVLTEETAMQSAVVKRSIVIAGHKTSVSLEDDFWNALKEIKRSNNMTLSGLVADIDVRRLHANLSSAIRIFVLHHYRSQLGQAAASGSESELGKPMLATAGSPSRKLNGLTSEQFER